MTHHRTVAGLAFTAGRRIEIEDCDRYVTVADQEDAARYCTTFLDNCAAEAEASRWFLTKNRRTSPQHTIRAWLAERPGVWYSSREIALELAIYTLPCIRGALSRLVDLHQVRCETRTQQGKPIHYYTALSE